jgi:hypothetical protein
MTFILHDPPRQTTLGSVGLVDQRHRCVVAKSWPARDDEQPTVTDGFADTLGEGGGRDVAKAKIRVSAEGLTHIDEDMAIATDGVSAESLDQATRLVRRMGGGALGSAGPERRNGR